MGAVTRGLGYDAKIRAVDLELNTRAVMVVNHENICLSKVHHDQIGRAFLSFAAILMFFLFHTCVLLKNTASCMIPQLRPRRQ
jgi:hypothetical protein